MLDERTWCPIAKSECCNGFVHMVDIKDVTKYKCPAWKNDKCSVFYLLHSLSENRNTDI